MAVRPIQSIVPFSAPRARCLSESVRLLLPWIGTTGVLLFFLGWASESGRGSPHANSPSPTTPGVTVTGENGDSARAGDVSANGIYASVSNEFDAGIVILHAGRILGEHFLPAALIPSSYVGIYKVQGAELSGEVLETEVQHRHHIERPFDLLESDAVAGEAALENRLLSGRLVEQESLTLTFNGADGEDIQVAFRYDDVYERTSSISLWEGTWGTTDENGVSTATLTVDADGAFFGQDMDGCIATGNLAVINPDRNLYGLELNIGVCGDLDGDYTGFAVYRNSSPGGIQTDRVLLLASTAEGRGFWSGRYSRAGVVPQLMPTLGEDDSGNDPVFAARINAPSGSVAVPTAGHVNDLGTGVNDPGSLNVFASGGSGPFGGLERPLGVEPARDDGGADAGGDPASDRAALVALYHATDGPDWINSENWLTDAPLGDWHGVDTDASGRVVRLDLAGFWDIEARREVRHGLTGPIPLELSNLTKLYHLDLGFNELTGPIPPELANLTELSFLNLGVNELTGPIPPELGQLVNLVTLTLWRNHLWGVIPPTLGNLTDLNWLNLRENELTGPIPPELGQLVNLTGLNLGSNVFSGPIPPELGNLVNLQSLSLTGRNLRGLSGPIPPELGNLTELVSLELYGNDLWESIPSEFGKLTKLEFLDVAHNDLSGSIPPELGELDSLEVLRLVGNKFTGSVPPSFVSFPLREILFAENDGLCVPGVAAFNDWLDGIDNVDQGPLCNESDRAVLEALYNATGGSGWTNAGGWLGGPNLDEWHGVGTDALGRVTALDLSDNGLSGFLTGLGELSQLVELRVDDNPGLSGKLPSGLADIPVLDVLHYDGTGLCAPATAAWRAWLSAVPSARETAVECAPVSDRDILVEFYRATGGDETWWSRDGWLSEEPLETWYGVSTDSDGRVVELNLAGNNLRGSIPPVLGDLERLRHLDLTSNFLSGAIPRALGRLAALEELLLGGNELSGRIPPELGRLGNLRVLFFSGNSRLSASIPPEIGNLVMLEELSFQGCGVTGSIPPELGQLANLERLRLGFSSVSGEIPPEIGGLASLKRLELRDAHLRGPIPPEIGNLVALEAIDLAENRLSGSIPPALGNLVNLTELDLTSNELRGEIPVELGNLRNLRSLSLAFNKFTGGLPGELGDIAGLESLVVAHNDLSGPVPTELAKLLQLRELVVTGNASLTGTLPTGLTDVDGLEVFHAEGTAVCAPSDAGFVSWLEAVSSRRVASCDSASVTVYLTQAVQSRQFPVPLVAGEQALLRVFPIAARPNEERLPPVRASFHLDDALVYTADIPGGPGPVPTAVEEGSLWASVNAVIPASVVQPGLEMAVEVDPEGALDPALGVATRIPETGRLPVDVRAMPVLDLTLIPFLLEELPDSSIVAVLDAMAADPEGHELLRDTHALLPVGGLTVRVHEPVQISDRCLLCATEAIRVMEGGAGHYMGTMSPKSLGFTGGGAAVLGGRSSEAALESDTIAHELGHNMSLPHAPCGHPPGPDPSYPNTDGRVGSWGYDIGSGQLVSPTHADLMSYCDPPWISDYNFGKALEHRLRDEGTPPSEDVPASTILLWGGADAEGRPYLEPAFAIDAPATLPESTGEYRISGHDADGTELFSLGFAMAETADGDGGSSFAFAVPVQPAWAGALAAITLTGPGGSAMIDSESDRPLSILRNPVTGQVRGILRDVPGIEAGAPEGLATVPTAIDGLEVLFSRGIPNEVDLRP